MKCCSDSIGSPSLLLSRSDSIRLESRGAARLLRADRYLDRSCSSLTHRRRLTSSCGIAESSVDNILLLSTSPFLTEAAGTTASVLAIILFGPEISYLRKAK